MFVAWLHTEAGYTFTGESTMYALTAGEMGFLYQGYRIMKQQQRLEQRGVSQHEQSAFRDFAADVNSGSDSPGAAGTP